jgi:UDP-N-acetyl-D-galactosamine dehydrogenase
MVADDKIVVTTLIENGENPGQCKVLVMGITFKEDVADIRNSKVVDMVKELMSYSLNVHVVDPWASANEVAHEYGLGLLGAPSGKFDAIVVAVAHKEYKELSKQDLVDLSQNKVLLFDIKGVLNPKMGDFYWKL